MLTVTGSERLPSTTTKRFISPQPVSVRGYGPILIWSSPGNCPWVAAYVTGTAVPGRTGASTILRRKSHSPGVAALRVVNRPIPVRNSPTTNVGDYDKQIIVRPIVGEAQRSHS